MKNSVQLQAVGLVEGTPAGEIKVGTTLLWNFGSTSEVIAIPKGSLKSIWLTEKSDRGFVYTRRFLKSRVIATL